MSSQRVVFYIIIVRCETSLDDQWLDDIHIHAGVCPGDPNQRQNTNAVAIRDAI